MGTRLSSTSSDSRALASGTLPVQRLHALRSLYADWQKNPSAIPQSWRNLLAQLAPETIAQLKPQDHTKTTPPAPGDRASEHASQPIDPQHVGPQHVGPQHVGPQHVDLQHVDLRQAGSADALLHRTDSLRALMLIRAYRVRGHLLADLDPLGLSDKVLNPELDPATYGFRKNDFDRPIFVDGVLGLRWASLHRILEHVRKVYCGQVGVEYMHIQDPKKKDWLQRKIENAPPYDQGLSKEDKISLFSCLHAAESLEHFLSMKFTGTKRFGLDGAESLIPLLEEVLLQASRQGVHGLVLGMAHRGRINVLSNVMRKPLAVTFSEFKGDMPKNFLGRGDVKYHLGASTDRVLHGRKVHLSMISNPSHLEAVNPVVLGKVRAEQNQSRDTDRKKVMGILIHGDAAFSGQGLVAETFDFSELKGYRTGGTIHVIVNNQIGFTTNPANSRSGPYCSEMCKIAQPPVVHVNGDNPEAVLQVARLAVAYRQKFNSDIVLDMFCYRRFGHNEMDEPAFTQPLMYKAISRKPSVCTLYARKLVESRTASEDELTHVRSVRRRELEEAFSKNHHLNKADFLGGAWKGLSQVKQYDARRGKTALSGAALEKIGQALSRKPENFTLNFRLDRFIEKRRKMFRSGERIDWATAEALAFGGLLLEKVPVRISGQDCRRGTFSQRHLAYTDQETEEVWLPLQHLGEPQASFEAVDSPLSELGVVGFEYGYSLADPRSLVIWEAQFGDFANGAQVMIDQFVSSGEVKWLRMSGLVLLLPHGYEGMGPEHSSARLERFLELCGEDNLQVVNCTTPANYFHVLRRQVHRNFRKPLIVMSPKSLLRHKGCVSHLEDFCPGSNFHRVLGEDPSAQQRVARQDVRQIVFCSGKVYYDLLQARGDKPIHLLRLEQLYPFPENALLSALEPYDRNCALVWCQEEPRNMGAFGVIREFIEEVAQSLNFVVPQPRYAGRAVAASPATGDPKVHVQQQKDLVADALTLGKKHLGRIAARKAKAALQDA